VVAASRQEIPLACFAARQHMSRTHTRHLPATCFTRATGACDVMQINRIAWIGDIDNGHTVLLDLPRQRIQRFATMMADVGNPATVLVLDCRLVRASGLQVVVPHELEVACLGLLCRRFAITVTFAMAVARPGAGYRKCRRKDC